MLLFCITPFLFCSVVASDISTVRRCLLFFSMFFPSYFISMHLLFTEAALNRRQLVVDSFMLFLRSIFLLFVLNFQFATFTFFLFVFQTLFPFWKVIDPPAAMWFHLRCSWVKISSYFLSKKIKMNWKSKGPQEARSIIIVLNLYLPLERKKKTESSLKWEMFSFYSQDGFSPQIQFCFNSDWLFSRVFQACIKHFWRITFIFISVLSVHTLCQL